MAEHQPFNPDDLDRELVDTWSVEAEFHVGSDVGGDVIMQYARRNDRADDEHPIVIHDGDNEILFVKSEVEDTQENTLERSVVLYRRILGHLATSEAVKYVGMNSSAIMNAIVAPYVPEHITSLDALAKATQEEIELMESAPRPPMLDVTSHVRAYLDRSTNR